MSDPDQKKKGTLARLFGSKKREATAKDGTSKAEKTMTLKQQKKEAKMAEKEKKATLKALKKAEKANKKDREVKRQVAKRVNRGRLFLDCKMARNEDKTYTIRLMVYDAKELMGMNKDGTADAYLKLEVKPDMTPGKDSKQKSSVARGTRNPMFKQEFVWVVRGSTDVEGTRLHVAMHNQGGWKKNEFMGSMSFALAEILDPNTPTAGWFKLLDQKKGDMQAVPFRIKRRAEADEIYGTAEDVGARGSVEGLVRPSAIVRAPEPDMPASSSTQEKPSHDTFDYLKVLGQGAFGKVMLAEHKQSKKLFAVKALSKEEIIECDDVECTMTERRVLALASGCKFLTSIYGSFQTPERLFFVMELVPGGDLMFHLQKEEVFSFDQTRFVVGEILLGLWYLHENGVLYRDLKLDNVMLDGEGHVKITDFGMCKEAIWGAATTTTFCGTPGYLAPEIIKEAPYGKSVDFWALGVLTYELLDGNSPFEGDDEDEIFEEILNKEVDMDSDWTADMRSFVSGLLCREPARRLGMGKSGMADIKAHDFFAGQDWTKLEAREIEPPYKPAAMKDKNDLDNFDSEFTDADVDFTPVDQDVLEDLEQEVFTGFSFVNPAMAESADGEEAPAPPARRHHLAGKAWYRPDLGRSDAASELYGTESGTFFIRESASQPGCYAIAVSMGEKCWNGLITPTTQMDGTTLYKVYVKNKFTSLEELISYYCHHPMFRDPTGAKIKLKMSSS
eukprot:m.482577 g.482577  ORF g.482577 m.482577 type:complete len:731 (-) comp22588_c0_seq1:650-2842(-)